MASVKSLGMHPPLGIEGQPADGVHTWDVIVDDDGEDELLTIGNCVIWRRGGVFRKSFNLEIEKDEPVLQALLTYFPATDADNNGAAANNKSMDQSSIPRGKRKSGEATLAKALVVFLKTQAHIFFLSGTSHIVHMPFEVESACAAPVGVIIQRKPRTHNLAPVGLKFPRVPPNSFMTSHLSPPPPSHHNPIASFSAEGLGLPKTLPIRLNITMENMFDSPLETNDSHWPRIVCLTDPLLELGLVVTNADAVAKGDRPRSSPNSPFLDLSDEILHVEKVEDDLVLAVTANREANMYTVWQLTYIQNEDIFTKHQKKPKSTTSRRRSSMQPRLSSEFNSPIVASFRESLGHGSLPSKKSRRGEKVDAKKSDEVAVAFAADNEGEKAKRQSRRVSSLLARADLSASHERTTFAEPPVASHYADNRRVTGAQRARQSSGPGHLHQSGAYTMNNSNFREAEDLLDELRAGGDFEGFHDMGLDDHSFDGLSREMLLTKIHTVSIDNTNVRYSLSSQPARTQYRVFLVKGPPFAADESGRKDLLIGIQDPIDKRLQLLPLSIARRKKPDNSSVSELKPSKLYKITPDVLRRAYNVVDSLKVSDGDQSMILILSENTEGHRELSIQAPWSAMTALALPTLYADNLGSLEYAGTLVNRKIRGRRSVGSRVSATDVARIRHSRLSGVVDLEDRDGKIHRIQIQLQPSSPHVRKLIQVCRSVLPTEASEKMLAGWWHIMRWMDEQNVDAADREWSALVIEILAVFLSLAPMDSSFHLLGPQTQTRPRRTLDPSAGTYEKMLAFTAPNGSACPSWMQSKAWRWMLDEDTPAFAPCLPTTSQDDFLTSHLRLAKSYMESPRGQHALGELNGHLPTAHNRGPEDRSRAAWGIICALHLLVEEDKLNVMAPEYVSPGRANIRVILCQIGSWLRWGEFVNYHELGVQVDLDPANDQDLSAAGLQGPPRITSIFQWIQSQLAGDKTIGFSTVADVYATVTQRNINSEDAYRRWSSVTPRTFMFKRFFSLLHSTTTHAEVVELMNKCGFTVDVLETLPEAVLTPLKDAVSMCQTRPPTTWSKELLALVHRSDIATVLKRHKPLQMVNRNTAPPSHVATRDFKSICASVEKSANYTNSPNESADRQGIIHALFKEDRRLLEADSMLSTKHHRVVQCNTQSQWTESELLEKQKEKVTIVATGTLAIPAGRGLMQFGLRFPLPTEKFDITGFNLTCLVKPTNLLVNADKSLFSEEKVNWAFFHQGAAAGLQVSPQAKGIDNNWITFNKPSGEPSNRHAGFLLALGLNGHLKSMVKSVAFKYLTTKHTMTSIGLLLGLAASFMGTMDNLITRVLTVHVTRLLPPGAAELNLSHLTQTAGLMGIGLVFCRSQHRRMSEIMLSEIEHDQDEDDEDPLRNEGYRLAAGFALGLINLGKGTDLRGLHDMRLTEKLLTFASTTKKVELVNVLDRAAPGAVLAIALMFMKSEDHIVARKIDVPDSVLQFTYVRPDVLLLRTLAKNLIMWSRVEPTVDWIRSNLPNEYRWRHLLQGPKSLRSKDMSFYSILAGLLFSLGLRFAGSGNIQVRDLLVKYLDKFRDLAKQTAECYDAQLARNNVQMCQDVIGLSAASVMAGTGDLEVLRRLRSLHGRDDPNTSYGSHMAAHLAIGALFLGSGTATFGTSNLAIASLLIAFYPVFPADVQDNRAHLQAFRHFWVFATDPRCLISKDIATGQTISVPIFIKLKTPRALHQEPSRLRSKLRRAKQQERVVIRKQTPCLLPPLEEISYVRTDATAKGYWNLELDFENNLDLITAFKTNQTLHLRQRPLHESVVSATLRALGRESLADNGSSGAGVGYNTAEVHSHDPLSWIFGLEALSSLTHAERAMVLNLNGGEDGTEEAATTEVDVRLALESGLDGWSRESLEALRFLFEWAEKRALAKNNGELTGEGEGKDEVKGWWLRDSVIEMLKGKAWIAAQSGI
ncbi:Anaphase-promoting complex subunit 1 [Gnomoniopsis smithogilvyi]|uniref:Anaphase-promoting complex subunit 1 n=1 Tax=Gnomoniopsis smithogilvyi TaxID=1191159 RepID=A0A9W8YMC9_9PEZI|nr:Anaphase-promoting complex subunit 1 [Gnomoniopsis smithogilvyi]